MTQLSAFNHPLDAIFSQVTPAEPIAIGPLHFVPIIQTQELRADALLLDEAFATGAVVVEEISEAGSVGFIRVINKGDKPLLILDGEQVLGAKQNRIFNASFLLPSCSVTVVPVSCVERGRWRCAPPAPADSSARVQPSSSSPPARQQGPRDGRPGIQFPDYSGKFEASETTITGIGRSKKLGRVERSLETSRSYNADQQAVWKDVDDYLEHSKVYSRTAAFDDAYQVRSHEIQSHLEKLAPCRNQVGVAVLCGNHLLTLDVFGATSLYQRAWKKVTKGILADVYPVSGGASDPGRLVSRAMGAARAANVRRTEAPGCGETLHGRSDGFVFLAIVRDGMIYHALVGSESS